MTKSRNILAPRHRWTRKELAILRREYPHRRCADVAPLVGHSVSSTYQMSIKLKLGKSDAFKASEASGRLTKLSASGFNHRFKKGHASWNKGTHWTAGGRSVETRFKKGRRPEESHNYRPVGSLRVTQDGILEQKVTDDQSVYPARRWVSVQRLVWEAAHGPIPAGHSVVFKNGERTTVFEEISVDRLECLSRADLMRRNTLHRYPKDIQRAIQLRGALMRQINKRSKRENEDQRPA